VDRCGEAAGVRRGTWADRRSAEQATNREVGVVAAVLVAGSEKAAAHRLGLSHSTVKHHLANARSKVGATTTAQLVWSRGPVGSWSWLRLLGEGAVEELDGVLWVTMTQPGEAMLLSRSKTDPSSDAAESGERSQHPSALWQHWRRCASAGDRAFGARPSGAASPSC
jgi:DNA-binding CsgD family transcriptional regulator